MSLNDELFIVRPSLIDLNPIELKFYPFIISLNKCCGSCNALSPKICFPKEKTKGINVKAFQLITKKNEAKEMKKHISHDFKCKFYSITCNSNQKWNKEICRGEHKNYRPCKKDNSWNPSASTCENSKHLKSIADTSVIACDGIITDMDIVLTKMVNTKLKQQIFMTKKLS